MRYIAVQTLWLKFELAVDSVDKIKDDFTELCEITLKLKLSQIQFVNIVALDGAIIVWSSKVWIVFRKQTRSSV